LPSSRQACCCSVQIVSPAAQPVPLPIQWPQSQPSSIGQCWIHALHPRQYFDFKHRPRLAAQLLRTSSSTCPRPDLLLLCISSLLFPLLQTHRGLPRAAALHRPNSPSHDCRRSMLAKYIRYLRLIHRTVFPQPPTVGSRVVIRRRSQHFVETYHTQHQTQPA
jgi:hypothetical protein